MAAMVTKQITGKVVSYCEIPEELTKGHWISEFQNGCFVQVHLEEGEDDALSNWLKETYPELIDENAFYIEIDY